MKKIFIGILSLFSTLSLADAGVRVSCWDGLLLRPWGTPGTYMLFVKSSDGAWTQYQKDLRCSFKRDPYESFAYFSCINPSVEVSLVAYNRICEPANNPHHETCHFWPVVNFSSPGGPTKTATYSSCNFDFSGAGQ